MIKARDDSPCSTQENIPSGFKTLETSRSARSGLGILQSVHVETTKSRLLSGSGICSAEASMYSTLNPALRILFLASLFWPSFRSSAYNLLTDL